MGIMFIEITRAVGILIILGGLGLKNTIWYATMKSPKQIDSKHTFHQPQVA
jgi:hypothetical protein